MRTENRVKRKVFMCNETHLLTTFILIACQVAS